MLYVTFFNDFGHIKLNVELLIYNFIMLTFAFNYFDTFKKHYSRLKRF